jgi:hypothetical protein
MTLAGFEHLGEVSEGAPQGEARPIRPAPSDDLAPAPERVWR